ncbi:recombinase family protein [Actinomadura viridis]|uniref:recombinase family protein n=1 Tax=Actinomadura viridis TaxID=58110 RepID=UPI0036CA52BE
MPAAEIGAAAPPIRIGYARCSTKGQELDSQLVALRAAGCTRVFSEKISTRVRVRPELEAALALCRDIKSAVPGQTVIFTVHELKRPARNAAELMTLASGLQAAGIQLELLSGPLTGIYDPNGLGAMLFAARCWRWPPSWIVTTSATRPWRASRPRLRAATTAAARR